MADEATPAQSAAHDEPKRRILIADDNVDAAQSLAMLLELNGHEIRTAHDGLEALHVAESFRPEIAFLDIGMPGLTGYELAQRIRAQAWGARVALVAITGWGHDEDKRRAAAAGFDHHLTKPVSVQQVREIVSGAAY